MRNSFIPAVGGGMSFSIWTPGFFRKGSVVFHNGVYFCSLKNTRHKPPSCDWHALRTQLPAIRIPHAPPRPQPRIATLLDYVR